MFADKAVIGVIPLWDDEKQSYWMLPGYMTGLEAAGAIPMMLPLTDCTTELDYFLEACDGFVLTGGHDVDPAVYGAVRSAHCGQSIQLRDDMEQYLLTSAVAADKAVLGICRGIQLMNAVYGGTLYQDLPSEHISNIVHQMKPPYDRCAHTVILTPDTPLHTLLQADSCPVNSYHHQAIRRLAPLFSVMATAPDGIVEGIYMPDRRFVWGVQWHPELSYQTSPQSAQIFAALVAAAKS